MNSGRESQPDGSGVSKHSLVVDGHFVRVSNALFKCFSIFLLLSGYIYTYIWASLEAQSIKRLPAMWETQVQSLSREDPLEKEMAPQSSILPGKSHGWRSLVGYSTWGCKESDTTERLN